MLRYSRHGNCRKHLLLLWLKEQRKEFGIAELWSCWKGSHSYDADFWLWCLRGWNETGFGTIGAAANWSPLEVLEGSVDTLRKSYHVVLPGTGSKRGGVCVISLSNLVSFSCPLLVESNREPPGLVQKCGLQYPSPSITSWVQQHGFEMDRQWLNGQHRPQIGGQNHQGDRRVGNDIIKLLN